MRKELEKIRMFDYGDPDKNKSGGDPGKRPKGPDGPLPKAPGHDRTRSR